MYVYFVLFANELDFNAVIRCVHTILSPSLSLSLSPPSPNSGVLERMTRCLV